VPDRAPFILFGNGIFGGEHLVLAVFIFGAVR
jgi:hypothetical protein